MRFDAKTAFICIILLLAGLIVAKEVFHTIVPVTQPEKEKPAEASALPLKIYVKDAITADPISSGTLYIYDPQYNKIEVATISNGIAYTVTLFKPGDNIIVYADIPGYYAKPTTLTVEAVGGEELGYYFLTYDSVWKAPTESDLGLSVLDAVGTQVASESSGTTYNMTATGNNKFTIHIVIPPKTALISYFDPTEEASGEEDSILIWIRLNDTLATLDIGERIEYGSYVYYVITLPDIIATTADYASYDITFTINYSGSGAVEVAVFFADRTSLDYFRSALAPDSDSTLQDSVAPFIIVT